MLRRLARKAEHVRHDKYPHERFALIAGGIEGKNRLREEGFLVYDLADIKVAYSAG